VGDGFVVSGVGETVGDIVGEDVGDIVGFGVVGSGVGETVGDIVGEDVGERVVQKELPATNMSPTTSGTTEKSSSEYNEHLISGSRLNPSLILRKLSRPISKNQYLQSIDSNSRHKYLQASGLSATRSSIPVDTNTLNSYSAKRFSADLLSCRE